MKQFATVAVIACVTNFLFEQKANLEALEEQVMRGQQLEAAGLIKTVKLYLGERRDVYWGVRRKV